jgi:hypothetical protein
MEEWNQTSDVLEVSVLSIFFLLAGVEEEGAAWIV